MLFPWFSLEACLHFSARESLQPVFPFTSARLLLSMLVTSDDVHRGDSAHSPGPCSVVDLLVESTVAPIVHAFLAAPPLSLAFSSSNNSSRWFSRLEFGPFRLELVLEPLMLMYYLFGLWVHLFILKCALRFIKIFFEKRAQA